MGNKTVASVMGTWVCSCLVFFHREVDVHGDCAGRCHRQPQLDVHPPNMVSWTLFLLNESHIHSWLSSDSKHSFIHG